MKILCELERFKEKVTRGRFTGQDTEYSISVGGDNYSWNISRVNLNSSTPPIGQSYCKGFCHLLDVIQDAGIDAKKSVPKIIEALKKNTGVDDKELQEKIAELDSLKEIGEAIDTTFKCNYNKVNHNSGTITDPERVYVRVLKANLKTTKEAVEA